VLGLRWFRDRAAVDALARDHGVSRATGYRYLDEVIEVPAAEGLARRARLDPRHHRRPRPRAALPLPGHRRID
jgi:hypothetical protein